MNLKLRVWVAAFLALVFVLWLGWWIFSPSNRQAIVTTPPEPESLPLAPAASETPEEAFLRRYAIEEQRVKKIYRHLQAAGRYAHVIPPKEGTKELVFAIGGEFTYSSWDDNLCWTLGFPGNSTFQAKLANVVLLRGKTIEKLFRIPGQGVVNHHQTWSAEHESPFFAFAFTAQAFFAPYLATVCPGGPGLHDFLRARHEQGCLRVEHRPGGDTIVAHWSLGTPASAQNGPVTHGEITFATKGAWIPAYYRMIMNPGNRGKLEEWRTVLEYDGEADGVPLIRKHRHERSSPLNPSVRPYTYCETEITAIAAARTPPANAVFQPETYGAARHAEPYTRPVWAYLLLAGLALAGLGCYKKWKDRRGDKDGY